MKDMGSKLLNREQVALFPVTLGFLQYLPIGLNTVRHR